MMKPIAGSTFITLQSAVIASAAPPRTYFGVAQAMMPGVKVLAAAAPCPALPLALVAAHVLECLLKAYLSRAGSDAALKDPAFRHDLEALWAFAAEQGLQIPVSPPDWVVCLSGLHKPPLCLAKISSGPPEPPIAPSFSSTSGASQRLRGDSPSHRILPRCSASLDSLSAPSAPFFVLAQPSSPRTWPFATRSVSSSGRSRPTFP
jgi:hypothetical protein